MVSLPACTMLDGGGCRVCIAAVDVGTYLPIKGLLISDPRLPPACLLTPPAPAECQFEEALVCLEQCSPATFQPSQLFPLFPTYTAAWAQQVRSSRVCWGGRIRMQALADVGQLGSCLFSPPLNCSQQMRACAVCAGAIPSAVLGPACSAAQP